LSEHLTNETSETEVPEILKTRREKIKILLRLVISIAILAFLFFKVDIGKIWQAIMATDLMFYSAAILLRFAVMIIPAYKLQVLLKAGDLSTGTKRIYFVNLISIFYSLFLPGDVGGAIARFYKLTDRKQDSALVLTSILIDRLTAVGSLALIAVVAILIATPAGISEGTEIILIFSSLIILSAILVLLISRSLSDIVKRLFTALFSGIRSLFLRRAFSSLWNAIETFQAEKSVLIYSIFLALLFQSLVVIIQFLLLKSLGIDLGYWQIAWIISISILIQMIPISYAGLGIREGAMVVFLGYYQIDPASAMAYSFLIFSLILISAVVGGILELFNMNSKAVSKILGLDREKELF